MTVLGRNASLAGLALALALPLAAAGCAQRSATGGRADAVALYEMGRTEEAYRAALREERGATGRARERAALTAGLAAHAMQREAEAARWLRPLSASRDDRIAGRADATLGLIAMADSDHERAATFLARAARKLDGEAAARANFHAAEAYALAGRPDTARLHLRLALARSVDDELKNTIRTELGEFAYTVQLGAYAERVNARRMADAVRRSSAALGLGEPVIIDYTTASGSRLFVVQVGRFVSRDEATQARVRLGRQGAVTFLKGSGS